MDTGYLYDSWLTNISNNTVSKIRGATKSTTEIAVGNNPYGICVDLNQVKWTTNIKSDSISRISSGIRTDFNLDAGSRPYGICATKNNEIWFTNIGTNSVACIVNGVKKPDIKVGNDPRGIAADSKNVIYVANFGDGTVSRIVNGVKDSVDIKVGVNPHGICVDKYDNVWVTNQGSNTVSKITNGIRVKDIATGKAPRGICIDKNNIVFITNSSANSVSVIKNDIKEKDDISVGIGPCGICADKDNVIYVTNIVSCSISRIMDMVKVSDTKINGVPVNFGDSTGMQLYLIANPKEFIYVDKISYDELDEPLQQLIDGGTGGPASNTANNIAFTDGETLQYKLDHNKLNSNLDAHEVTYHDPLYGTVEAALDKLLYAAPVINLSNNINTVEIGSVVSLVKLTWNINKNIKSQIIDNGIGALDVATRTFNQTVNLTTDRTWTLIVDDGTTNVGHTATKTTSVNFVNKRYWGTSLVPSLTDAGVLSLSSELSTSRAQSRVLDASGGKYIYFAMPVSFGCDISKFKIGGLFNSDWQLVTRAFINANGHSAPYNIFRSTNIQTGSAISVDIV